MLAWLLNVAYLAALVPWLLFRVAVQRKPLAGLAQKVFGLVPQRESSRPALWLHAVSVGEVVQLQPLIAELSANRPDLEFVISTTTATGYDVARAKFPACRVIYYPFDFSWSVRRALARIRPTAIVLIELELWPNFLLAAADLRIPVLLVNGRITERSCRGYRRLGLLARAMLGRIRIAAMQNETYAARLASLGLDRARLHVTGSIKFDGVETDRRNSRTLALARAFGLDDGAPVFIAGSTQDPEERIAIEAYLSVREKHPDLRLIVVPRHKERFDEVARLITDKYRLPLVRRSETVQRGTGQAATGTTAAGHGAEAGSFGHDGSRPTAQRSACVTGSVAEAASFGSADRQKSIQSVGFAPEKCSSASSPPVLLLDTLGELSACWGLATVAFVGGSLTQRGGQNMIEPAGYGAAVMFGPNTWNFKDVVELLVCNDAAVVVHDAAALTAQLERLLSQPAAAKTLGERARELVVRQRGATERTAELVRSVLSEAAARGRELGRPAA